MKQLKIIVFLSMAIFLSACSFGYNIVIINDSDKPIELRYKIGEKGQFDEPSIISLEDWKTQKSIRRFWTEEKSWQKLPENDYETNFETRERVVRIAPRQIIQIEAGHYNPVTEEYGDLTGIIEIKINSANGKIAYKERLLLNQFEKDNYTFIKRYKHDHKDRYVK